MAAPRLVVGFHVDFAQKPLLTRPRNKDDSGAEHDWAQVDKLLKVTLIPSSLFCEKLPSGPFRGRTYRRTNLRDYEAVSKFGRKDAAMVTKDSSSTFVDDNNDHRSRMTSRPGGAPGEPRAVVPLPRAVGLRVS